MTITKTSNGSYRLKLYVPTEARPSWEFQDITTISVLKQKRRLKKLNYKF